jgi:hypothetical protein
MVTTLATHTYIEAGVSFLVLEDDHFDEDEKDDGTTRTVPRIFLFSPCSTPR